MSSNQEFSEELKKNIVKQVEYYFSDENLIRAKFLRQKIQNSGGGWIHLNLLNTFKRLANLNTTTKRIGKAISQSKSKVIEISTDLQRVRRINHKLPPVKIRENVDELILRSAYVEGFSTNLEIHDLIKFFDSYSACHVIVRKYLDKATKTYKSKGSAFVTFPSCEACDNFLKKKVVLNGIELKTMHQNTYKEMQAKKMSERKLSRR